jgi:protein involved in polysaccharide export with SLBB domain
MPRQNVFSVLGAVMRPGTYGILRRDFTVLEALALSGDVNQVNIPWIYIIRPAKGEKQTLPSSLPTELPPLPTIPSDTSSSVESGVKSATTTSPATTDDKATKKEKLDELAKTIAGGAGAADKKSSTSDSEPAAAPSDGTVKPKDKDLGLKPTAKMYSWVYSDGRWVSVPHTTADKARQTRTGEGKKTEEDIFGWGKYDMSKMSRIIAIDLPRLKAGDPSLNIIIRNKDIIHIPMLEVGEFYVMGEVLRPGVYSLTGRKVTAKMAVAAAGNLGPLAWPNNSILIRRVGRDKEQTIPLKLQDIFHGREPDVFLKPNDVIAVGSYWAATPLAIWRNAFRMTYGFGFIYDRNFSEYEFEIPLIAPKSDRRNVW